MSIRQRSPYIMLIILFLLIPVTGAQAEIEVPQNQDLTPMGFSPEDFHNTFNMLFGLVGIDAQPSFEENSAEHYWTIEIGDDAEIELRYINDGDDQEVTQIIGSGPVDQIDTDTVATTYVLSTYSAMYYYGYGADAGEETLSDIMADVIIKGSTSYKDLYFEYYSESDEADFKFIIQDGSDRDPSEDDSENESEEDTEDDQESYFDEEDYSTSSADISGIQQLVSDLQADSTIPESDGEFHALEDYSDSWAQINWYQWNSFDKAENFVFTTHVSWESAAERPNTFASGCGLIFRDNGKAGHLGASINMDGNVHIFGQKNGYYLSYHDKYYGPASIRAEHDFTIIANGDLVIVYVDGERVGSERGVAFTDEGNIGLAILSGTNKGFGTRCEFTESFYYIW